MFMDANIKGNISYLFIDGFEEIVIKKKDSAINNTERDA